MFLKIAGLLLMVVVALPRHHGTEGIPTINRHMNILNMLTSKLREKRNLLTDLIQPHMDYGLWMGPTEELPKMSYEEFCTGAQALADQLKIDRELVTGKERETADYVIKTLEDLTNIGQEVFDSLLNSRAEAL